MQWIQATFWLEFQSQTEILVNFEGKQNVN